MSQIRTWLAGVGEAPNETEIDRTRRHLLIYVGLGLSAGATVWAAVAAWLGLAWPALLPAAFAVLTAANFAVFARTKSFAHARSVQVGLGLAMPFLLQWSLGGFLTSGGAMLWALVAVLGSLTFGRGRTAVLWLLMYLALAVLSGVLEPSLVSYRPHVPTSWFTGFFVLNVVAISTMVFGLTVWLLQERDRATAALEEAQKGLLDQNLRLNTINRDLEWALADARDASEAKSRFLANISHEIRTPLNAILGLSEILRGRLPGSEDAELAETVHESAAGLLMLLTDVLDFSKGAAGEIRLARETVDLRRLIHATVRMVRSRALGKGLELVWEVDDRIPIYVESDEMRLRQILNNLASNAVKFTEQGKISLSVNLVTPDPDYPEIEIVVSDTGVGIDPADLGRLFEPFSQVDETSRRVAGGTGLGLAICKQIVDAMEGTIDVESARGAGATFRVRIKVAADEPTGIRQGLQLSDVPVPSQPRWVLVVEDNAVNQMVAQNVLESLGHKVSLASGGVEAIAWLAENTPDFVFMDCQMPEMDGYETTQRLRAGEAGETASRLPIVALTAHALPADRRRCLDCGMDEYLTKPFVAADLQQALDRFAPSPAGPAAAVPVGPPVEPQGAPDGVDPDALGDLAALGSGPGTPYYQVLTTYIEASVLDFNRVNAAVDAGDFPELRAASHRLKGASLQVGAQAAGEAAARIERAAGAMDLDAARAALADLGPGLDLALAWMRTQVGSQAQGPTPTPVKRVEAASALTEPGELPLALVVDDDATMRGLIARVLGAAGFEVREESSGPTALAAFEEEPADIVLLDVLMVGMDGYETCRRLREIRGGERVPVLMLTGLDDAQAIQEAYEAGATDFITKPFKSAILANRARYGLRAARAVIEAEARREAEARARQATDAKSAFLANMSHELRTPLNAILGYSEMLMEDAEGTIQEDAGRIHAAGSHLLGLVNDVLDLSRIEADRMELDLRPVRVHDVVEAVRATILPLTRASDNELVVEQPEAGEPVVVDGGKLKQILLNLLSNANKFTDAGTVTLRVSDDGDGLWTFEVTDTGKGIAPGRLAHVFEPFTQEDEQTQSLHGGTGLGLTISRRLCRLMGGDLVARSRIGEGSTFTATIRGRQAPAA